eukprot:jgi/Tetstr1/464971/TSEL_009704.t1
MHSAGVAAPLGAGPPTRSSHSSPGSAPDTSIAGRSPGTYSGRKRAERIRRCVVRQDGGASAAVCPQARQQRQPSCFEGLRSPGLAVGRRHQAATAPCAPTATIRGMYA